MFRLGTTPRATTYDPDARIGEVASRFGLPTRVLIEIVRTESFQRSLRRVTSGKPVVLDLRELDSDLASWIATHARLVEPALRELVRTVAPDVEPRVRFRGLPHRFRRVERIRPMDGALISIEGVVREVRGAERLEHAIVDTGSELVAVRLHGHRLGPGLRVEILGIVRSATLDALEVHKKDPIPEVHPDPAELEEFRELADKDPLTTFARAIAPLPGAEEVGKMLALQLFSCVGKNSERLHVLLAGYPVVCSEILHHVLDHLAPRGVYVDLRRTELTDLTAVLKEDRGWALRAGAAVLADGGILAVDHLEGAPEPHRWALMEAMDKGTVTVDGIALNARCAVLAAINPGEQWPSDPPIARIDLDQDFLSHFDLIAFLGVDPRPGEPEEQDTEVPSYTLLRRYLLYAIREHPKPELTEEARKRLEHWYETRREEVEERLGMGLPTLPVTRRQLESVERLAKAHARMRLSDDVEPEDVDIAAELVDWYLETAMQIPGGDEIRISSLKP
ncbi:Predicted ATPase involved in replication control, Cdc46/Mcm family [Methanopyrus kandleri AV19]|uniref:Predicted ATPase involved in replication control, Cdc46/Mcm family n=1 Tax=Methanopyrus kandleri (strain AV19 / DSM 6324 / JCM 9639 / NBRC 100938) TaxID=190192 RepID=Q8TWB5_METKA|nr:Predicted ATPase involved in replication control, Cdc46/Mcm family [Methanopyrus kandleri AV19]